MKITFRSAALAAAVTLAPIAIVGCAATPTQEAPREYISDAMITTKVKAAILEEPSLKVADVNVETFRGVVQLSGFVDNPQMIAKATEVAGKVSGVKSVKNDLRLKQPPARGS